MGNVLGRGFVGPSSLNVQSYCDSRRPAWFCLVSKAKQHKEIFFQQHKEIFFQQHKEISS